MFLLAMVDVWNSPVSNLANLEDLVRKLLQRGAQSMAPKVAKGVQARCPLVCGRHGALQCSVYFVGKAYICLFALQEQMDVGN